MDAQLLEKAVKSDMTGVLKPVLTAAYSVTPLSKIEVTQIAIDTNKKLGFDLFSDLYYPRLILDFSRVARAVAINAVKNND